MDNYRDARLSLASVNCMTWEVPGFIAEELIGFGASGEVWRARDVTTNEVVALKRLRVGQRPTEHHRLRREAAVMAAFTHPHVLSLRAVLTTADGLVLVLDHAAGGSLGGLIARRGRCTPGEVVRMLVRIAGALAAAHAVGLTHGDVSPGNVLLDASGQPVLADLGTARLLAEASGPAGGTPGYVDPAVSAGHPPGPASDVYALAAVAVHALTGAGPGADPAVALLPIPVPATLRRLLRRSLDRDPAGRPSAAAIASDLHALGVEEPLQLVPGSDRAAQPGVLTHAVERPAPPPAPTPPRWKRWRRRLTSPWDRPGTRVVVRAAAAAGLLIGALTAGLLWGSGTTGAQPGGAGAGLGPSWDRVWSELDSRRAQAFATADATVLDQVYLPDCPALATDLKTVRDLAGRRARATGVAHQVRSVRVEASAEGAVTLLIVDRMSGYQIRGPSGELLAQSAPRGDRRLRAQLVHTKAGWRIASLHGG